MLLGGFLAGRSSRKEGETADTGTGEKAQPEAGDLRKQSHRVSERASKTTATGHSVQGLVKVGVAQWNEWQARASRAEAVKRSPSSRRNERTQLYLAERQGRPLKSLGVCLH